MEDTEEEIWRSIFIKLGMLGEQMFKVTVPIMVVAESQIVSGKGIHVFFKFVCLCIGPLKIWGSGQRPLLPRCNLSTGSILS